MNIRHSLKCQFDGPITTLEAECKARIIRSRRGPSKQSGPRVTIGSCMKGNISVRNMRHSSLDKRVTNLEPFPSSHLCSGGATNGPQPSHPYVMFGMRSIILRSDTLMIGPMDSVNPATKEPVHTAKLWWISHDPCLMSLYRVVVSVYR